MIETILYIGVVTAVDWCVDFKCQKISEPNSECRVYTNFNKATKFTEKLGVANYNGGHFEMWWFQTGVRDGGYGETSNKSLALFFNGRLDKAYMSEYHERNAYTRETCTIKYAVRE